MAASMNTEHYFDSLKKKLRGIFLMIKNGHETPAAEKKYVEGFMHAAIDLGIATRSELDALMESVNQEVFGMSIDERRKAYRGRTLSSNTAFDTPTWQRKGIQLSLGE